MDAINENLVDIVIPTMWRGQGLLNTLFTYVNCDRVGRVILIENDRQKRPQIPQPILERLVIICHEKNIYVNPAWNEGVSQCTSKFICLANDDIAIDEALFEIILSLDWDVHEIDIIGLGTLGKQGETEIRKAEINKSIPLGTQIPSFGACMFMPRCKYSPIPKELRVWYGDDYLVHNMTNIYILDSPLVTGSMSATIRSFGPHSDIHSTIMEDIAWARKNLLTIPEDRTITEVSSTNPTTMPDSHTVSLDLGCGNKPRNPFKATKVIGIDPHAHPQIFLRAGLGLRKFHLKMQASIL